VSVLWAPRAVDGAVLNCVERPGPSEAPLVLMIHSLGCDHRVWDMVAARLPNRVASYDIRGHGLSAATPGATMERHAADALALLDALGADRGVLCGLSIGGLIAMEAALAAPGRVAGLVLADTAARIGSRERYEARAARVRKGGIAAVAEEQVERWFASGFADREPGLVAALHAMLQRQPVEGYLAAVEALACADLELRPAAIACPTLCLVGAEDRSTPPEQVAALAALIPGAEFAVIEGAGHLPPVEAPEETATHILRLLRRLA
jgi:3-oxoadipate enol-lactonase